MRVFAVTVRMLLRSGATAMGPLAQGKEHTRVAAQRQGREQQDEKNKAAGTTHGGNPSTKIAD